MKQYSACSFEMNFVNSSEVKMRRFQKICRPDNWEVVMELFMEKLPNHYSFDHFAFRCKLHVFKTNTSKVFEGSSMDRLHVFSKTCYDCDPETIETVIDAVIEIADVKWKKKFPLEAAKEKEIIERKKINFRKEAFDQIENVVMSISKKDPQNLKKSDFCFITTKNDGSWHCFYPTVNQLIDYHLSKSVEEQNIEYLKFLESDTLKDLRQAWNNVNTVTVSD